MAVAARGVFERLLAVGLLTKVTEGNWKLTKFMNRLSLLTAAATLMLAGPAYAGTITYQFLNITNNSSIDLSGQLSVEVSDEGLGPGQVSFKFLNAVGLASSITDVYFDDGTLLGIANISSSAGVKFSQGGAPPNLPGGNGINFQTTAGFLADSDPPVSKNGVNSSAEWLEITFNLINGKTYADTIAALNGGIDLRIGLHMQALSDGESDSYVNTVSVPDGGSAATMLGVALMGLGILRRRFGRA